MTDRTDDELERCRRRLGTSVGGMWRLDELVGIGGMAAVYAATHNLGRRDAIKILHPEIAVSKELRQRFEREAQAIGRLQHPATVQVSDVGETEDGAPFMVMELLDGESLGQRAQRLGGIAEDELLRHMATVLDVLGAAHEQGIVHRDIKPDNLFVTADAGIKVLDFGIAHIKQGGAGSLRTRTGALLGTTSYMAPEQILGRAGIDGRVDLYAVGASMFRILAKRRIHEAASDAEMLMQMGTTPAPSLHVVAPHVGARVSVIVDRALAFDRERRYPDAATMRADIEAVLRGEEPPFAAPGALASDSATRAEAPAAAPPVAAVVAAALGPTRVAGPATEVDAIPRAEPTPAPQVAWAPSETSAPRRERTHVALPLPMVAIAALLLLVTGGVAALFLIGDCGGAPKKTTAANDEDGDRPTRSEPAASSDPSSAAETGSGQVVGEDRGKGRGKGKGKGKGHGKHKDKEREKEEKRREKEEREKEHEVEED